MSPSVILHRASWVVSIANPIISDGAVAVAGNRIIAVGEYRALSNEFSGSSVQDHGDAILLPPLVNAHTHLELSHLQELGKGKEVVRFTTWIESLLAARKKCKITEGEIIAAGEKMLAAMEQSGIGIVADIGNAGFAGKIGKNFKGMYSFFHEKLGLSANAARRVFFTLENASSERFITGHAPYSTHPDLLVALKERAARYGHIFSLHVAETESELTFLRTATGEFCTFFEKHGFWDDSFQPPGIDINGSVQYLDNLGVLDEKTLCVHAVHVSEQEIALLAARGAKVCLCPGSNRFLGVGIAPVGDYLRHNILPALGTDSAASNPCLSIWREMRILREDHPHIPAADILAMATLGGANSLGVADLYGTLEAGKSSAMLAVAVGDDVGKKEIPEFLVSSDRLIRPKWIS